mmetsp:Transcript_11154/g.36858  ORF Transcript_11154/g.36858 Transcript_11154/m.36858 type:complete len:320 (-) Transcript_11154:377-1336(-)
MQERGEPLSFEVVKAQNASTTDALIRELGDDADFRALSALEGESLAQRDAEDASKLEAGIRRSISLGVLPEQAEAPSYKEIDVLGKSPDEVCDVISRDVPRGAGAVIVLCGLSGTGKGTTLARLAERLPNTTTWSNGNCFRALTLLATRYRDARPCDLREALTPANVASFVEMLTFESFQEGEREVWDLVIDGLGYRARVSEVKNTDLKSATVSQNVPTVAKETQGEVVLFANKAVTKMKDHGLVVLLEGREATVNYIDTPHRYALAMSDAALLGKRRAAQRVAAALLDALKPDDADDEASILAKAREVTKAMLKALQN